MLRKSIGGVLAIAVVAGCDGTSGAVEPDFQVVDGEMATVVPCPAGSGWTNCRLMTYDEVQELLGSMTNDQGDCAEMFGVMDFRLSDQARASSPVFTFESASGSGTLMGDKLPDGKLGFRRSLFAGGQHANQLDETAYHEASHIQSPGGGGPWNHPLDDGPINALEAACGDGAL
jgi:hypothetical protein